MSIIDAPSAYAFQTPQGGWRVTGSRVSLDSVVHSYKQGMAPEQIISDFPSLSLEQVYGAIAFYLRNRQAIDEYLQLQEQEWERLRQESARRLPDVIRRLQELRNQQSKGSEAL